jgi:predicted metal-dependent hydrolase
VPDVAAFTPTHGYSPGPDLRRRIARNHEETSIELAGRHFSYTLKRSSARRTLALRVSESGGIVVNAPLRLPQGHVEAFIRQHVDWLMQHLARRPEAIVWRDGLRLPFLGGELRLTHRGAAGPLPTQLTLLFDDTPETPAEGTGPILEGDRLICPGTRGGLEASVRAWYVAYAQAWLGQRLAALCREQGRAVPPWRLSDARGRWGSLSARGVVGLNWRLVKAAPAEIDYVICHELAHFKHRDHSPAFWREVARLHPGYADARRHLRAESRRYFEF